MTVQAIIEIMEELGFPSEATVAVKFDLLTCASYIPADREGSALSKVLNMIDVKKILESTPIDKYRKISHTILVEIINKFAQYPILHADNVDVGMVIHFKGGRYLSLHLNDSIKTNFNYWDCEGHKIAEKLKELTNNVWEIHIFPSKENWYTVAYSGNTLLGVSKYPVEAFPSNVKCVQYKEIVDYKSGTYISK